MERAEAEAIYDSGPEECVSFILDLAARAREMDERLSRLEAQARQGFTHEFRSRRLRIGRSGGGGEGAYGVTMSDGRRVVSWGIEVPTVGFARTIRSMRS